MREKREFDLDLEFGPYAGAPGERHSGTGRAGGDTGCRGRLTDYLLLWGMAMRTDLPASGRGSVPTFAEVKGVEQSLNGIRAGMRFMR